MPPSRVNPHLCWSSTRYRDHLATTRLAVRFLAPRQAIRKPRTGSARSRCRSQVADRGRCQVRATVPGRRPGGGRAGRGGRERRRPLASPAHEAAPERTVPPHKQGPRRQDPHRQGPREQGRATQRPTANSDQPDRHPTDSEDSEDTAQGPAQRIRQPWTGKDRPGMHLRCTMRGRPPLRCVVSACPAAPERSTVPSPQVGPAVVPVSEPERESRT